MAFVKTIIWNLFFLFLAMLVVDLIAGGWVRESSIVNRLNLVRDVKRQFSACDLYERPQGCMITYTRDPYGLRGDYDSPSSIDILTVGGSTTDQRYVSDEETWQAVISKTFEQAGNRVTVVNAGVDGQTTWGHLKNFEEWFPEIGGLGPKYILFYVGINDFYKRLDDDSKEKRGWRWQIQTKSAWYYLYKTLLGMYISHAEKVSHRSINFSTQEWVNHGLVAVPYRQLMQERLDAYADRLFRLSEKTREFGAEPIFVTQQTRYAKLVDGKIVGVSNINHRYRGVTYNGVDRYFMHKELNRVAMEVCGQVDAVCIDLAEELSLEDTDFYDFLHNTPAGAERIGKYLYIKTNSLL